MAPETLTFCCPHCSVRLKVPAAMAGVTGPCPSCKATITAPAPTAEATPAPESPVPAAVPAAEAPRGDGPKIRPEPRHLPERGPAAPIPARRSTDDDHLRQSEPATSTRAPRSSRLVHALLPATFSALAVSVVYFLLYFFLPNGPRQKLLETRRPLNIASPGPSAAKPPAPGPVTPAPAPPPVEASQPAPLPAGESPTMEAYSLLTSFLNAKDAAARVGMVEPAVTEEDLAATLLKGPLPEFAQIFSDLPHHNPDERLTDYPFRVSFFVENQRNMDYAILVRQRGDQAPKVFLPAFLDLVGGRLARFTEKANSGDPAVFHVILEAVTGCHDESVPNADHKFTFKLLPSPFGRETARSYVSSGSRFKQMVDDPASSLRWGVRARATVTLQWNHREDPEMPYLELIDINSLNWDP